MHSVPLELPVKTSEAAKLAGLIFQQAEGRRLDAELRKRLSARMQDLQLASVVPLGGSLQRDPIHPSTYYLAADTRGSQPQHVLLRIALASSPSSGLFPKAMLIGRMRTDVGPEVVVNAIPFNHSNRENIRTFAERVDPEFLPSPQGASPTISVEHDAFETYRGILRSKGMNLAAIAVKDEASLDAVLWAAIRAGWREGYTVETEHMVPNCTKYTVAPVWPCPWERLADLYNAIQVSSKRHFDFEVSFANDRAVTTPQQLAACLQFLKSQGKPAQSVIPRYETIEQLAALSTAARQSGALLTIVSTGLMRLDILEQIGQATGGRVNYKIRDAGVSGSGLNRMILLAAEHLRA